MDSAATFICDRCGCALDESAVRYVVKMQVYAAGGPIKISVEQLFGSTRDQIAALLKQCEGMTEEELMRDVFVEKQFLLCLPCQREFLKNPLLRST
jgi:hypothetical protein